MAMQEKMYARAQSIFERMSPEEQQAEEADMVSQGFTSDEDQTEQFIKKYTNPELFQAAMQEAKPNAFQEIGSALTAGASALGAGLKGQDAGAAGARATKQNREAMDRPGKALEATQGRVFDYLDRQTSIAKAKGAEERAQAGEGRKVADFERQQTAQAPLDDPSSDISVMSRGLAGKLGIPVSEEATASQLNDLIELRAKVKRLEPAEMSAYEKAMLASEQAGRDSREKIAEHKKNTKVAEVARKEAREDEKLIQAQQPRLAKALAGQQAVMTQFDRIEEQLGMTLEEYMAKADKPDLPGTNIPGIGRIALPWDDAAQGLKGAVSGLSNRLLKEFSGAAVTQSEFIRFRDGMEQGRFNTEEGMIRALIALKDATKQGFVDTEAAFGDAVQVYSDNNGRTSLDWTTPDVSSATNEVVRKTADGREAVFDADTKEFIRWVQ